MMQTSNDSSQQHYRVVRFYTDFAIGVVREVLASHLNLDEARELVEKERRDDVPGEDTLVEDELKHGMEAVVEV